MDCRDFENRLDVFEAGLLTPEEQARTSEHIHACQRCRALLALARGESDVLEPEAGDNLARAILRRTSGTACLEAEQRLCDFVDETLGADDQEILSLHLAHCADCSGLAETLVEVAKILPGMATLDPDAGFTGDVLRATSGLYRIRPKYTLRAWWNQLVRRPRFAWEAAYVGTLLLLLALGNPAMLPRTSALPQILTERSNRLLLETTSVLQDRRVAAGQSLSGLRLQGKALWDEAAALRIRTASALQRELTSMLEQLKLDFFEETPAEQRQNDLR